MTIDLAQLATRLAQDATGIWRTPAAAGALSFPDGGHDACFAVEDDSFWHAHRSACIVAALRRARVAGPLLDVGGGNGAVGAALERAAFETVVLEPGPDGARNARRRGLRHVVCATLEDAAFRAGAFAAAGLFDVVEHVADDTALCREVNRVVRPGGALCVTVPAHRWLWSDEDEVAGHHRRYTIGTLRALLESSGFRVAYATYLFAALAVPMFVLRSVPHHLLRRDRAAVAAAAERAHLPSPVVRRAMAAVLAPELQRVRAGRAVPIGTSCLAVAVRT